MKILLRSTKSNPTKSKEIRYKLFTLRKNIRRSRKRLYRMKIQNKKRRLQNIRFKNNDTKKSNRLRRSIRLRRLKKSTRIRTSDLSKSDTFSEHGKASYYADMFNGRTTASGDVFSNFGMTAAHKTLPFGTHVRVTNKKNGKTVDVRINDRGPYTSGRIIDLSSAAFSKLDDLSRGVLEVEIKVLAK